jgi:predicted AlkP superfamily phosphohydrolase/phosphomutase
MADSSVPRTLLLGIDAACQSVLDGVFDDGAAPTLERVVSGGASGPLESQHPPWTPSAWPSLYTGVNPGKHGAFGFLTFDGYDWDVVNRTRVREHAIWETLDRYGHASVVVNVPVTHPPRAFDGALVPGYVAPEDPDCHPDGLLADVRDAVGDYTVYARETDGRDDHVAELRRLVRSRGRAFRYLADRFDPEFGFLQFQATDAVFHELPDDDDAVAAVYEAVDEAVAATIDAFDPDAVLVVSDHGVGEYTGYEFRVNEFLRDRGYVETTRGGEGMPSWSSIARNELRNDGGKGIGRNVGRDVLARAAATAATVGLTSQLIETALDAVGLAEFVAERAPTDAIRAGTEQVDFAASSAYVRSRIECGVRINLAGREPDGEVSQAEYESVRDDLLAALDDARTPDGDPVFDAVLPREDVFEGPYVEDAADVQVVPADYDQYLSASLRGDAFGPPSEPYNHKRHGVVAATGDAIDADADLADAHLLDVAPTVLALYGIPAAERMDGSALPVVEATGSEPHPEFDTTPEEETDDAAVEQRLADLGYIE